MTLYAQVDSNNQVISINNLAGVVNQSNLIPITDTEFQGLLLGIASVGQFPAKSVNGVIQGMYAKLTYDVVNKKVNASINDYKSVLQTGYSNPVTFNVDTTTISATPTNGVATIDVSNLTTGTHTIKTTNSDLNNSTITIQI